METYGVTVFHWKQGNCWDQEISSQLTDLSIDAAREVARALSSVPGHSAKLYSTERDYTEVAEHGMIVRKGKFAEVTRVRVAA